MRQLPGPANSMGEMKFAFANKAGHLPARLAGKGPVRQGPARPQQRLHPAGGRARLGRWLLGRDPTVASNEPEQQVMLPKPVPVFVTYLTAHADDGQLTLADDIYGRDSQEGSSARMASLH